MVVIDSNQKMNGVAFDQGTFLPVRLTTATQTTTELEKAHR
jgi:hypothetical protein